MIGLPLAWLVLSAHAAPTPARDPRWPELPACSSARVAELERESVREEDADRPEGAIAAAKKILELCPGDYRSMTVIGGLYGKMQRFDEELEWTRRALALKPTYWQAHVNRGNALAATGNAREARASFEAARRASPGNAIPVYSLGTLREQERDDRGALALYEEAIRLDPDFENARFNRAAMLANLGRKDDAKEELRRILAKNPSAADARAMLADLARRDRQAAGAPEDDPEGPWLAGLKRALDLDDDRKIEQAARSLTAPPEYRPPPVPKATTLEEVEALSVRIGYFRQDPRFVKFIEAWKRLRKTR